jgi:hypothetical protein
MVKIAQMLFVDSAFGGCVICAFSWLEVEYKKLKTENNAFRRLE